MIPLCFPKSCLKYALLRQLVAEITRRYFLQAQELAVEVGQVSEAAGHGNLGNVHFAFSQQAARPADA